MVSVSSQDVVNVPESPVTLMIDTFWDEWHHLIVSSTSILKTVLLHNGKMVLSLPLVSFVYLKEYTSNKNLARCLQCVWWIRRHGYQRLQNSGILDKVSKVSLPCFPVMFSYRVAGTLMHTNTSGSGRKGPGSQWEGTQMWVIFWS